MTIVIWIIVGGFSGLLFRILMPVAKDHGNAVAAGVGAISAVVAGIATAVVTNTGVIYLNPLSIGWAVNGAFYALFAYRCLTLRSSRRDSGTPCTFARRR